MLSHRLLSVTELLYCIQQPTFSPSESDIIQTRFFFSYRAVDMFLSENCLFSKYRLSESFDTLIILRCRKAIIFVKGRENRLTSLLEHSGVAECSLSQTGLHEPTNTGMKWAWAASWWDKPSQRWVSEMHRTVCRYGWAHPCQLVMDYTRVREGVSSLPELGHLCCFSVCILPSGACLNRGQTTHTRNFILSLIQTSHHQLLWRSKVTRTCSAVSWWGVSLVLGCLHSGFASTPFWTRGRALRIEPRFVYDFSGCRAKQ